MVHHFCFMRPIRSLFGMLLLVGAVLCFYRASVSHRLRERSAGWARRADDRSWYEKMVGQKSQARDVAPPPNPPQPSGNADETKRPDWVGQSPHLETRPGGFEVYVATATAGPYSTPEECDRAIDAEIDRVVTDFAEKELQPAPDEPVKLDRGEIRQHLIQGRYRDTVQTASFGPMQQEHVLLVFDNQVRAAILQQWRATLVDQRLKYAAMGSGAVLLALGGVYSLLKWKPAI